MTGFFSFYFVLGVFALTDDNSHSNWGCATGGENTASFNRAWKLSALLWCLWRQSQCVHCHGVRVLAHLFICILRSSPLVLSIIFATPPIKQKTGTANRSETTNSKPHRPIIMVGQSKTGSSSQIIIITLCSGRWITSFYQPQQMVQKSWAKNHFAEPNRHVLTFLHPILIFKVTYWVSLGMLLGIIWSITSPMWSIPLHWFW
jgi:hypothetical protein